MARDSETIFMEKCRFRIEFRRNLSGCIAKQIFTSGHFDDIRILILVTKEKEKDTASTDGMRLSVETSEF